MNAYVKPDFDVMEFVPDEYVSSCDGSVIANITCTESGSPVILSGGYDNGNGLYTFNGGGWQLYTDVYTRIDGESVKDTTIDGILVGTISDGHNTDTTQPRQDGEFSYYGPGNGTYHCDHFMIGADGNQMTPHQHHHLSSVLINNHS